MNENRSEIIQTTNKHGIVVYLMTRDLRIHDNYGLLTAQSLAKSHKTALITVICLDWLSMYKSSRHYKFLLEGIKELKLHLKKFNIKLFVFETEKEFLDFVLTEDVSQVVYDFMPLKKLKSRIEHLKKLKNIGIIEVDSHNLVPTKILSDKKEYGAVYLRRKIKAIIGNFLYDQVHIEKQEKEFTLKKQYRKLEEIEENLIKDTSVKELDWILGGYSNAVKLLNDFCENKIQFYAENRNNPLKDVLSNLSPYLHFGQISQKKVLEEVVKNDTKNVSGFLDELIVRTALAENYCNFCPDYDNFDGFPAWAQASLSAHKNDIRTHNYSLEELEKAKTHDDIWNFAQNQMLKTGKMHSYLRMYWAKKLLEWTKSPEIAQKWAIYLNDKYELDGTDPNGYTGIAWSIGGVHDRAFQERDVFGKIRYMSYLGCKKKFKN